MKKSLFQKRRKKTPEIRVASVRGWKESWGGWVDDLVEDNRPPSFREQLLEKPFVVDDITGLALPRGTVGPSSEYSLGNLQEEARWQDIFERAIGRDFTYDSIRGKQAEHLIKDDFVMPTKDEVEVIHNFYKNK